MRIRKPLSKKHRPSLQLRYAEIIIFIELLFYLFPVMNTDFPANTSKPNFEEQSTGELPDSHDGRQNHGESQAQKNPEISSQEIDCLSGGLSLKRKNAKKQGNNFETVQFEKTSKNNLDERDVEEKTPLREAKSDQETEAKTGGLSSVSFV